MSVCDSVSLVLTAFNCQSVVLVNILYPLPVTAIGTDLFPQLPQQPMLHAVARNMLLKHKTMQSVPALKAHSDSSFTWVG